MKEYRVMNSVVINEMSIKMMNEMFGTFPRLELYSIETEIEDRRDNEDEDLCNAIEELGIGAKDLSKGVEDPGKGVVDLVEIRFDEDIVYKRDKDEKNPIGGPLSLTGPCRPFSPLDPIEVCFYHKRGWWYFTAARGGLPERQKDQYEGPLLKRIPDPNSKTVAVVSYELFTLGVDARIEITCEGLGNMFLQILSGEIYALTNRKEVTKRLLRSFGPNHNHKRKRLEDYEELYPGQALALDRSRVAVPVDSYLNIVVDFEYKLLSSPKKTTRKTRPVEVMRDRFVRMTTFEVPKKYTVDSTEIFAPEVPSYGCPTLNLNVTWCDDQVLLLSRYHLDCLGMGPSGSALQE